MTHRLRVSDNRRFLVRADDGKTAFFFLGDRAWELFHRTTREDADKYLRDRAKSSRRATFTTPMPGSIST